MGKSNMTIEEKLEQAIELAGATRCQLVKINFMDALKILEMLKEYEKLKDSQQKPAS